MYVDNLTATDLRRVHLLYEMQCGREMDFASRMGAAPEELLKTIKNSRSSLSYEVGSRWSQNSKLVVKVDAERKVSFVFVPELDSKENKAYKGASKVAENFNKRIRRYLAQREAEYSIID